MSLGVTISSAAFNLLNIYICFRIISIFLEKRRLNRFVILMVYFFVWLLNWCIYYLYNNVYYTSGSMLILLMMASGILYQGRLIRKIVAVCSSMALGMVVDDIVWRIFAGLGLIEKIEVVGSLISSLVLILIVLVLERFFRVDKTQYISKESYVNIIIVLLGNIVLLYIFSEVAGEEHMEILLAAGVICVIDISTFYLYDKVNEVYYHKIERHMMEERIAMYENQFEIMQQSQKNMSALRHDMKNHLYLIKSYLYDRNYVEARSYIEEIEEYMEVPKQHVNTGNKEVDTILNYTIERAVRMSCKIETHITVPSSSFMPDFDLNMLLSNLLDNALEALEKTEERYLYVEMNYQKGVLLIQISNSFDGTVIKERRTFITKKQDKRNHGVGLKNVEEIIKKYDGEQVISIRGTLFKVNIVLYMKKE